MLGGVICGYCARGKLNTATAPVSVTTIDNTDAKMGRLIKNREIKAEVRRVGFRGDQIKAGRTKRLRRSNFVNDNQVTATHACHTALTPHRLPAMSALTAGRLRRSLALFSRCNRPDHGV